MTRQVKSLQAEQGTRLPKAIGIVVAVLVGLAAVGIVVLLVVAIAMGEEQRHHWRHDVVSAWHESETRDNVHARLGEATFATRITAGGRSASCDVFNAYDSVVREWVQFTFCYDRRDNRIPSPDPLEPNEDVAYLHAYKIPSLTRPGKPSGRIRGRLDYWPNSESTTKLFDSEDVYRVWVPSGRALRIHLVPTANVALEVWDSKTESIWLKGAARDRHLIRFSDESGKRSKELTLSGPSGRAAFVYLDVYLLDHGPNHAEYDLAVTATA